MLTTPKSRIEQYLADIVGQEGITIPDEPKSRVEAYLDYIIQNGVKGEVSFKGVVATVDDLPTASTSIEGNVYKVTEDGNIYFCDGTQWVNLSSGGADGAVIFLGTVESTDDLPTAATTIKGNIYEVTADNNLYFCDGTQWVNLTSGGSSSSSDIDYIYGGYEGVDLTQKFASEIANYTDEWAWIKARITAGNFEGIHIHDYIPVSFANRIDLNAQVAGINTYKGTGDNFGDIGNHIDFISDKLWGYTKIWGGCNSGLIRQTFWMSNSTMTLVRLSKTYRGVYPTILAPLYKSTTGGTITELADDQWTYNQETGYLSFTSAPGPIYILAVFPASERIKVPFLCTELYAYLNSLNMGYLASTDQSVVDVNYTTNGVYYNMPQKLKDVISEKYIKMPTRYSTSPTSLSNAYSQNNTSLGNTNAFERVSIGKVWIPNSFEVFGFELHSGSISAVEQGISQGFSYYSKQYPIFKNGKTWKVREATNTVRDYWYTCTPRSNSYNGIEIVSPYGNIDFTTALTAQRFPVCFRIMGDTT